MRLLTKTRATDRTTWLTIDWKHCYKAVFKLQQQIAEAYKTGDLGRVSELQNELVRSFAARALAVRKVYTSPGHKTPGVDGVVWKSQTELMAAIEKLKDLKGYTPQPVRRVYIPKPIKGLRPLGIPTLFDRAMQALFAMALLPIAETKADTRSFGYRPLLSTKDAMIYLKLVLGGIYSRRWVLEGDIAKFFDNISHDWVLKNIPIRQDILKKFLKAGFVELNKLHETESGTPQGGVISPLIANLVLDGLQPLLEKAGFRVTRYADDFVVVGKTKEDLEEKAKPLIQEFLKERGLSLNLEKTVITSIEEGFNYLGFHFREFPDKNRAKGYKQGIFLVKPPRAKVLSFVRKLKEVVRDYRQKPAAILISKLNPLLRGWAEYYKPTTAKKAFAYIGWRVWKILWGMLLRKHRGLPRRVLARKYFKTVEGNNWVFFGKDEKGKVVTLYQMGWTEVKRHSMTKPFNPFLAENEALLEKVATKGLRGTVKVNKQQLNLLTKQKGVCPVCKQPLLNGESLEVHHVIPSKKGGTTTLKNLKLLHKVCHAQVTKSQDPVLRAVWTTEGITAS